MKLQKRGKYRHARFGYESGERDRVPLKVTNLTVALDRARKLHEQLERGEIQTPADRKNQNTFLFTDLCDAFLTHYLQVSVAGTRGSSALSRTATSRTFTPTTEYCSVHFQQLVGKPGLKEWLKHTRASARKHP